MYNKKDLAINGGIPARVKKNPPMFPGGMQYDEKEEQAVLEVLRSKRLFRYYGPFESDSIVEKFEEAYAEVTGVKHALGVNSCTNALVAALVAAGVQPGDEVIVPAYTFVASAAAIVGANAIPVITEVDDTLTLDPAEVEKNITQKTKAIMVVHMRGVPGQMDEIMAIAKKHNIAVIEDVAQSNGGSYKGKMLGSIGNAGCFSLQYHKVITTGEGGVITTNDDSIYARAQAFHDTGANWRMDDINEAVFPGFNFRMTEMQGALGKVQLGRRQSLIEKMRKYKAIIKKSLSEIEGVQLRRIPDENGEIAVCLMFFLPTVEKTNEICDALVAEGIEAGTMGSKEIPDWHVYIHWKHIMNRHGNNDIGFPFTMTTRKYSEDMCPKTLDYLRRSIHLDINPMWTDKDVEEVVNGLKKVLNTLL